MEQTQPQAVTHGYRIREVAEILDLPARRVRAWVRAGWVEPQRDSGGATRLTFRDVALLRRIRDLEATRIPPRRVHRALDRLRATHGAAELAPGLRAARGELVVREGDALWSPESGQCLFDFEPTPPVPVLDLSAGLEHRAERARDWFEAGGELESRDPERAREAYARALAADPSHADAYLNLGCLEHRAGDPAAAEAHYRAALALRPADPIALFNLAVALEDRGRDAEARESYAASLAADPAHADAHFNLARLCERLGDSAAALRHWTAYRQLVRD